MQLKNSLAGNERALLRETLAHRAEVYHGVPILWAEMKGHQKASIIFFYQLREAYET